MLIEYYSKQKLETKNECKMRVDGNRTWRENAKFTEIFSQQ